MPHAELIKNYERLHDFIPNDVVKLAFDDDMSAAKPWRMRLELTQADIAERIGISQGAYLRLNWVSN